jgi:type II secretory pathway component PulF
MPQFTYKARTAEGEAVEASIEAPDRSAAILLIEREGRTPISIQMAADGGKPAPAKNRAGIGQNPPLRSLSDNHKFLFTEQLAHLLSAGVTLDESLGILRQRLKHPELQGLAESLHRSLVDGRSLSMALRDFPKIFSPLYVNMVAAGEVSGALSEILRRLVLHLADVKALRDRVQQALVYPAVLVVAGIGLVVVFMTVMVPQLSGFFSQTGQTLPLPTRILLGTNYAITHYWWVAALGGGLLYAIFKQLTRSPEGRRAWDRFRLKIPGYGGIIRYRFYAQFARTMGTLMENGVTMLKALELLEEISGNEDIRVKMAETRRAVIDGASLSNALRPHHVFPELFLDMMAVGEQTGRFGETMQMIANVYERELDKQVKIASTLIPPVIMVFIAAIVGLVVLGILSAVFNLTSGLRTRIG